MIRTLLASLALVTTVSTATFAQPDGESFADWLDGFRGRLEASGATPDTVASMLDGLEPDMRLGPGEPPDLDVFLWLPPPPRSSASPSSLAAASLPDSPP